MAAWLCYLTTGVCAFIWVVADYPWKYDTDMFGGKLIMMLYLNMGAYVNFWFPKRRFSFI
jgi:hypothetical protein